MRTAAMSVACAILASGSGLAQERLDDFNDANLPSIPPVTHAEAEPLATFYFEPVASVFYESNPLRAVSGAEKDDVRFVFAPRARLALTGDEVRGEVLGGLEIGRSVELNQNDYLDADLRARGRWQASRDIAVEGDLHLRRDHNSVNESSGDLSTSALEVTQFHDVALDTRITHDLGEASVGAFLSVYYIDFEATVPQAGGLPPLFNEDRDRVEFLAGLRNDLALGDGFGFFAEGHVDQRTYFENLEGQSFDRSSIGATGLVGLTYVDESLGFTTEAGIGLEHRSYDSAQFGSETAPIIRLDADYRPSGQGFRLRGRIESGIRETDLSTSSGFSQYRVRLDGSQELGGDYLLGGRVDYQFRDFDIVTAGATDRADHLFNLTVWLRSYFFDSYFIEGALTYEQRSSDAQNAQFNGTTAQVSVGTSFRE